MNIKTIKTKKDYQQALSRLEVIFDAKPNTGKRDEFGIKSMLLDKYEETKFPIDLPDSIEAIKFRMEQMNMKQKDLAEIIGLKSRVSEILNRKRKLTIDMIRNISSKLSIPADVLIQPY